MTEAEIALDDFFAHEGDTYVNPHGFEIALTFGTVFVSGEWTNAAQEDASLAVIASCNNFAEFIEFFCIEGDVKSSIDRISLGMLMNLYLAGTGAIACTIDAVTAPSLEFYKRGKSMVAKDEAENVHEVEISLKTPADFMDYTKQYFELNKHLTGYTTAKKGWPWSLTGLENN